MLRSSRLSVRVRVRVRVRLPALILALVCAARPLTCMPFGLPAHEYALREGESTGRPTVLFDLPPDLVNSSHDYKPVVRVVSSDGPLIQVLSKSFELERNQIIVTAEITITTFPGTAQLRYQLTLPDRTVKQSTHPLYVLGIVLYDQQRHIFYTGKNARSLRLRTDTVTTVDAKVFNAPSHVSSVSAPLSTIRMGVKNSEYSRLLPWHHQSCGVFAAPSELNDNCSMAFSEDFTKFSFRIPNNVFMTPLSLDNPVRIVFKWQEVSRLPSSNTHAEPLKRDSQLTTALVHYPKMRPPISSLPAWKIAVIIIISILGFVTLFVFMCCCLCAARHGSPESGAIMFSPKSWALGMRLRAESDVLREKRHSALSQEHDVLARQEALSRSLYSQDTLGAVSRAERGEADHALIPDERMLAALMNRDGEGEEVRVEKAQAERALTGGRAGERDGSVDDELELQLELMRSRRRGGGGGSAHTRGSGRERMAFGAACERMKVVNMLIGPVSRGLISGNAACARGGGERGERGEGASDDGEDGEDDEVLQFSSEEFDMDVFDETRAVRRAGAGAGAGAAHSR